MASSAAPLAPKRLDLKRDERLRIEWPDGRESTLSISLLRQMCPCALCKMAREGSDPHQLFRPATPEESAAAEAKSQEKPKKRSMKLSVLPPSLASEEKVAVARAEMVGNYAIRLHFTDGHASGIYTWVYLRELSAGDA